MFNQKKELIRQLQIIFEIFDVLMLQPYQEAFINNI